MVNKVSILIPAYNEQGSIEKLYNQIIDSLSLLEIGGVIGDYEIWFVNDGSTDDSEEVIDRIISRDGKVHIISFRKNFGKSPALDAGFHHVTGDIVFTLDADLQDDPAEFSRFLEKIEEGYDLVVGWKFDRLDPLEKKLASKLFNRVTSLLSGISLHDFDCGFKCFRREVIDSIDLYGELHRYIPVLAYRNGFRITEITVQHHRREYGSSKYGIERYMRGLFDSMTTTFLLKYNDRPMYFFGRMGILSMILGFIICFYLTMLWMVGEKIGGRPLLILGVLCMIIGIQMIATGFIGNIIVDTLHRSHYKENHIKRII
jgi:glycosyltransferase involved in cell wall biosynthesis